MRTQRVNGDTVAQILRNVFGTNPDGSITLYLTPGTGLSQTPVEITQAGEPRRAELRLYTPDGRHLMSFFGTLTSRWFVEGWVFPGIDDGLFVPLGKPVSIRQGMRVSIKGSDVRDG